MTDAEDGRAGPLVLALDAATYTGAVAVLQGSRVLAERAVAMRGAHEERLMPAVADALAAAGAAPRDLAAIACGGGPGSFTSLRIAASIAKGLAAACGAPLVAVPSLALVAVASGRSGRVLATMDAMRGERYAALVTLTADARGLVAVADHEDRGVVADADAEALARTLGATRVDAADVPPAPRGVAAFGLVLDGVRHGPANARTLAVVDLAAWEPDYGRKAEAQVKWEDAHGRALPAAGSALA